MSLPVAILAGGLATRLKPLTEQIPKVLLNIAGKPFAVHQIELLHKNGINDIVFCLGYLGEKIQETLGSGQWWGVNLKYVFDGPTLLGTGGAIKKALDHLGEAFFVLYGDTYLDCSYNLIEQCFYANNKSGLMTVLRNDNKWDLSNILFTEGHIVKYDKKNRTNDMHHIDYGLGILKATAFDKYPEGVAFDLESVYQDLLCRNELIGFEVRERFYEIGSIRGLEETRQYLRKRRCYTGGLK